MKVQDLRRGLKVLNLVNNELNSHWDGEKQRDQIEVLVGIMLQLHESNRQQAEMNTKLVSALDGIKKELDYIGRSIQDK